MSAVFPSGGIISHVFAEFGFQSTYGRSCSLCGRNFPAEFGSCFCLGSRVLLVQCTALISLMKPEISSSLQKKIFNSVATNYIDLRFNLSATSLSKMTKFLLHLDFSRNFISGLRGFPFSFDFCQLIVMY